MWYIVDEATGTTNTPGIADLAEKKKKQTLRTNGHQDTIFGSPRDFLDNRLVYAVVSARARGLALGINMCPDKKCNFNCIYCEVHRNGDRNEALDVELMATELKRTLTYVR